LLPPKVRFTGAVAARIHAGMSRKQVEGVLGCARGDYRQKHFVPLLVSSPPYYWFYDDVSRDDDGKISVCFDETDQVIDVGFENYANWPFSARPSLFDRMRSLLGW
jgi:hypothetical protein